MTSIIPDPGTYQEETAQALRAYENAINAIATRRSQTLQNYGFTAQVDPTTGQLQNYHIDPNNPYGAIEQLFDSQQVGQHGLEQSNLARGLGTSGLAAQLASALKFQQGADTQKLGQDFMSELSQESADQINARDSYSDSTLQAQRDAIAAAINNQQFNPAPVAPTQTSTAPGVQVSQYGTPPAGSHAAATNPGGARRAGRPARFRGGRHASVSRYAPPSARYSGAGTGGGI